MAGIQYDVPTDVVIGPVVLNEHPYTPINNYEAADFVNANLFLGMDDAVVITLSDTEDAVGWIRPYGENKNGMYRLRLDTFEVTDVGKSVIVRLGATDAVPTGTPIQYEVIDGAAAELLVAVAALSDAEKGLAADVLAIAGSETAATILGAIADLSNALVGLKSDVAAMQASVIQSVADKANEVQLVPDDPDNATTISVQRAADNHEIALLAIVRDPDGRIIGLEVA